MKDLADLADLVYKLGFPIFVAVYLLTRFDRILTQLIGQNQEMLGLMRDVRTAFFVNSGRGHDGHHD